MIALFKFLSLNEFSDKKSKKLQRDPLAFECIVPAAQTSILRINVTFD